MRPGKQSLLPRISSSVFSEGHLFLADVTFQNPGVILETGVALGLKPIGKSSLSRKELPLNCTLISGRTGSISITIQAERKVG